MEPMLSPGDGVFVWQSPFESIKKGDLIVFVQYGELITHQVIELGDGLSLIHILIVIPVFVFFVFQVVAFFKALFAYQKEKMRLEMLADKQEKKEE